MLTKNVDGDGFYSKVSLADDFRATFIHATVAGLDVVDFKTIFFQ